jgi:hypothetical protein
MRLGLALAALWSIACTTTPPPRIVQAPPPDAGESEPPSVKPEPAPDHAVAEATLVPEKRVLDVTLTVPLGWLPREADRVAVRFRNERFRAGPTNYSEFVRSIEPAGNEVPWQDEQTLPPDRVLRLRYRVHLEHAEADPVVGKDEVPHPTRAGWFLNGRAFLPRLYLPTPEREKNLDLDAELVLHVPESWALESSAGPVDKGHVRAPSLAELHNAIYYTGQIAKHLLEEGNVSVTLATTDFATSDAGGLSELVRRTLALGNAELGPIPPVHLLVVYDRDRERAGGVVGRGISLLYDQPPDGKASSSMGVVVVHELMHLWNRADAEWLSEGFTRWLELVMSLRLDNASKQETVARLLSIHDNYARAIGSGTIAGAKDSLAYSGGAVLAFCTDADLRADNRSLFVVHRNAREKSGVPLSAEGFLAEVDAASEKSGRAARERLAKKGPIDFGACLRRAGYKVRVSEYAGITGKALALDVLHIRGHDTSSAKVLRADASSPLREGDVVESVEGSTITSMEDIPYLLRKHRPGQPIHLLVRRGTDPVEITLTMPKLPKAARPKQRRYSVVSYPND